MNPINPNLSDEINKNILDSELKGGVWLQDVPEGKRIIVRTKHTRYIIDRLPKADMIFGHEKYCPEPTKCSIHGSTWGGSMLKMQFIGVGMCLEFSTENHPKAITTSEIQSVEVL